MESPHEPKVGVGIAGASRVSCGSGTGPLCSDPTLENQPPSLRRYQLETVKAPHPVAPKCSTDRQSSCGQSGMREADITAPGAIIPFPERPRGDSQVSPRPCGRRGMCTDELLRVPLRDWQRSWWYQAIRACFRHGRDLPIDDLGFISNLSVQRGEPTPEQVKRLKHIMWRFGVSVWGAQ
jgi:hypothetical protein